MPDGMDKITPHNRYLDGNFAPVPTETTAFDLPVHGHIPEQLEGRFLRIGPNPVTPPDPAAHHWFTGTGMVHGVRLRGGRAEWYRSRYVVSGRVAEALGRADIPGPHHGFGDNTVNTNVADFAGRTYALVEAGALPIELSYELDSIARSDFDGSLQGGFAAHPKRDKRTGESLAITYEPGRQSLRYVAVDPAGVARTRAEIPAPHGPMVHDMAFTATSVIVLDLPVRFSLAALSPGGFPYAWDAAGEPRVGLLPRGGDLAGLQWFTAPSCYVFHVMNAYDEGPRVIMDVVRHPRMFDTNRLAPDEGKPILVRWTLDRLSGQLSEAVLDDRGCEFPRLNAAFEGQPYRYGYSASWGDGLGFGEAMKHDVANQRVETHDYGAGRVTMEPVFVPRAGAVDEDDGWVMSYVYDAGRNATDVVILAAQDFGGAPVATIELPVRVPFGFHGDWARDPD